MRVGSNVCKSWTLRLFTGGAGPTQMQMHSLGSLVSSAVVTVTRPFQLWRSLRQQSCSPHLWRRAIFSETCMQLAGPVLRPLPRGRTSGEKSCPEQLGSTSQSSRWLLQLWDQLVVSEGVLCRQFESADGSTSTLQVIVPTEPRNLHDWWLGATLELIRHSVC